MTKKTARPLSFFIETCVFYLALNATKQLLQFSGLADCERTLRGKPIISRAN